MSHSLLKRHTWLAPITVFVAFSAFVLGASHASASALGPISASTMGTAGAGSASMASDASNMHYNPALMTQFRTKHLVIGGTVTFRSSDLSIDEATDFNGDSFSSIDDADSSTTQFAPSIFYLHPFEVKERPLVIGLGITTPYQIKQDFGDDEVSRYTTTESKVNTLNINPNIAYQLSQRLSVGAGFSVQYLSSEYNRAVDLETICKHFSSGCGGLTDGSVSESGSNFGYGWNAGLLYQLQRTAIGLSYRSSIKHDIDGDVEYDTNNWDLGERYGMVDKSFDSNINVPGVATLSVTHMMTPRLSLMADVSYIGWSTFENYNPVYSEPDSTVQPTDPHFNTQGESWDDSFRFAVGTYYRLTERFRLRGGVAYETDPMRDDIGTPMQPGGSVVDLAAGIQFILHPKWILDAAYMFSIYSDTDIDMTSSSPNGGNGNKESLEGELSQQVSRLGLQLIWLVG